MTKTRDFPYIWATWLPALLTGENSCEWAGWFKANHQNWAKPKSDFDQAAWLLNHTQLLNQQREIWIDKGYDVFVEAQNSFTLRGTTAVLGGKPDLIAVQGDDAVIIDAKSGKEKPSHVIQVMIYQYAVPRALERFRGLSITGRVTYPDHQIDVPHESETPEFPQMMGKLIQRLASQNPAIRVPNQHDCRFCDILECTDRFNETDSVPTAHTTDF